MNDDVSFFRALGVSEVKAAVKEAVQLKKDFPDVIAGFDMVRNDTYFYTIYKSGVSKVWCVGPAGCGLSVIQM